MEWVCLVQPSNYQNNWLYILCLIIFFENRLFTIYYYLNGIKNMFNIKLLKKVNKKEKKLFLSRKNIKEEKNIDNMNIII